jgi:hypothetical protein
MNAGNEAVTVQIGEAQITVPKSAAVRAFLQQVLSGVAVVTMATNVPRIGSVWPGQGGIYAGIVRGDDGEPDYHLIVGGEDKASINWNNAVAWAKTVECDGHQDFGLPKRNEQAVLFGNTPELFQKEWYWSCEQYASDSYGAWGQDFYGGYQGDCLKSYGCRARAVRRLVIE